VCGTAKRVPDDVPQQPRNRAGEHDAGLPAAPQPERPPPALRCHACSSTFAAVCHSLNSAGPQRRSAHLHLPAHLTCAAQCGHKDARPNPLTARQPAADRRHWEALVGNKPQAERTWTECGHSASSPQAPSSYPRMACCPPCTGSWCCAAPTSSRSGASASALSRAQHCVPARLLNSRNATSNPP